MRTKALRRGAALGVSALMTAALVPALPPAAVQAAGSVVINEVCTKNTTAAASDGLFYDYVELYNTNDAAVSVGGWGLSDDPADPMAYTIPAGTSIPQHGYLLIWCGVTETAAVQGAPFGLSKKGETVILSAPSGQAEETMEIPALADDTAYGRVPDGSETFAVLTQLSPGAANDSGAVGEISVPAPQFSKDSGFYDAAFDLSLTATGGCKIYYTTDGSDPTAASTQYTAPISVRDVSAEPNVYAAKTGIADGYNPPSDPVDKAMIVRAVAVDESGRMSDIATKSYFIGYDNQSLAKTTRVISLVTDPDNLFDYEKGIYVRGKTYDDWRQSSDYDPRMQSYEQPANWTQSGKEWERPAHMTVFVNGVNEYSAGVGIRVHGGATRSSAQKSLNLYARADYGTSKLEYDFFDGELTDQSGKVIKKFDKITLRNGGNDEKTKIRDRLNQEMLADRSFGTQAQTMCIVFLDGEFWGAYNIVEKIGKEYISDHYDVKEKDVCMIKTDELSDGTEQGWADYEKLKNLALSGNVTEAQVGALVDLKSFADYMAAEILLGNSDFGGNNYALWKTETVDAANPYADGKWRFLLFDTEFGSGLYGSSNANTDIISNLRQLVNKDEWLPKLFFALMQPDSQFMNDFVAAYYDMANENLRVDRVLPRLEELSGWYKEAMTATIKRFGWADNGWGGWTIPGFGNWQNPQQGGDNSESTYTNEVSAIQQFWQSRDESAKRNMVQDLRQLGADTELVKITVESAQPVDFNTLTLPAGTWSGSYPKGFAYALAADTNLSGWSVSGAELASGSLTAPEISIVPSGETTVKAEFGEYTGYTAADARALMNILLRKATATAQQGSRYDLDGDKVLTSRDLTLLKREMH